MRFLRIAATLVYAITGDRKSNLALERVRLDLEGALDSGAPRALILGDEDTPPASQAFLAQLETFPPTARRLVLARAYALPWRDRPSELPECYRRELAYSSVNAADEYPSMAELDRRIADLFVAEPTPVSGTVLRQLVSLTPSDRQLALFFAFWSLWFPDSPGGEWKGPDWLRREYDHAAWLAQEEYPSSKGDQ